MKQSSGAQTVERAAALLDLFSPERPELRVAQATELLGISKTSAHRLLAALRGSGYLRQTTSGTYTVGAKVLGLARTYARAVTESVRTAARPHMQRMLAEVNETVSLYVREGDARYCIERLECSHALRVVVPVGAPITLEYGASGHVLRLDAPQAATIPARISRGERVPEACAVAAPVVDAAGAVLASLQITVPMARSSEPLLERFAALVSAHARELSTELRGGNPAAPPEGSSR